MPPKQIAGGRHGRDDDNLPVQGPRQPWRQQNGAQVRAVAWVFTFWPNLLHRYPLQIDANGDFIINPQLIDYIIFQQEQGLQGGEAVDGAPHIHYQGYVEFPDRVNRDEALRRLGWPPGSGWIAPRYGTQQQAIDYVTKLLTRVLGTEPTELGTKHAPDAFNQFNALSHEVGSGTSFRQLAQNSALRPALIRYANGVQKVLAALDEPEDWRDMRVTVLVGSTGVGKSRKAYRIGGGAANVYTKPKGTKWWDGYHKQETILFDDFHDDYKIDELLRFLDGHPLPLESKGTSHYAHWTHVIITSNIHPDQWYPAATQAHRDALKRRLTEIEVMVDNATVPNTPASPSLARPEPLIKQETTLYIDCDLDSPQLV